MDTSSFRQVQGRQHKRRRVSEDLVSALREREQSSSFGSGVRRSLIGRDRLRFNLDDLVGLDHPASKSVILGFSMDSNHLFGYSRRHLTEGSEDLHLNDCGYIAEIWRFNPPFQLECAAAIPLFRCPEASNFGATELFDCVPASIAMAEYASPSLLLVIGSGSQHELDQELQASRRFSMTLVLGQDAVMAGSGRSHECIVVLHTTFLVRPPFPPIQCKKCVVAPGFRGDKKLPVSLVVNTGDSIRIITVSHAFGVPTHFSFGDQHEVEVRLEKQDIHGEKIDCRDLKTVQACFDAEQYLSQLLDHFKESDQMPQGTYCLSDYDLRLVETQGSENACWFPYIPLGKQGVDEFKHSDRNTHCLKDWAAGGFAAIGIVAVLEGCQGSQFSHVMFGHLLLLDICRGTVLHRMSTKLQACHPKVLEAPSALVARFLELWQNLLETHVVKQFRDRNICVMDNDALLRGKSVESLRSPFLPVVLTAPRS